MSPFSLSVLLIAALMCGGCGNDDQTETETATSAQALNSCTTVPSDLLAWWGGDGSGAQLAGTYPMIYDGADYLPGKVTQAFDFDGVNYGTLGPVANRIDLAPKPGFTLAAWIKKGTTSTQSIMDERAAERHFEWRVLNSGLLEYSVSPSSLVSTVAVADNQWHFVVLTHDKVTQVAKIYVDGNLNVTGTGKRYSDTGNGLLTSVNGFAVTRRSGTGLDMDEPMIFGRALSATEILGLYNAGDGGGCKPTGYPVCGNSTIESLATYGNAEQCDDGNLTNGDGCSTVCKNEHAVVSNVISWWKFSEGTGFLADDYIDGNDGTLTPTSVWGTGAPGLGGGIGPSTSTSQSARVDVPDRPNQHLGKNPFTITFWVNARTNISLSHRWFEKLNLHGAVSVRSPDGYQCCGDIKVGLGGATNDVFFQAGRVNDHDVHATAPIVGTGWKHIAAVRETNGTLRIYVDCVLKASRLNTAAVEPILNVTNRGGVILGSGQSSQLDEVMLFDKALSITEICDVKGGNYPPDACPSDPNKVVPGICGCGVPDTNTDGDSVADCNETCDSDPAKTSPGVCGCGVSDADGDADGTADCSDACPSDPNKIAVGACGCGVADTNTDGDGAADCNETCDSDPAKTSPGVCGCGVSDIDTDLDGAADCNESCDVDPYKTAPGVCGCGVSDADGDADGTADCSDACPSDPNKIAVGACGCGVADTNTDGDGAADCNETCDSDPAKTSPGVCGCGVSDADSDGDGSANCNDTCPFDANNDDDDDDACDDEDHCPDTHLDNSLAPTSNLGPNQVGDDNVPNGSNTGFNMVFGCNCSQILTRCYTGKVSGQFEHGCTKGVVNVFNSRLGWARDANNNNVPDCIE